MSDVPLRQATIAAHALTGADAETGAVVPPLDTATTFARDGDYALRGPTSYARGGNPTLARAEAVLAALEQAPAAQLFSSGMAAIGCFFETVPHGRHVVAPSVMYHGTRDWLKRLEAEGRIKLTLFDPADPEALKHAIRPGETDVVWIETPVNPTWDVIDIAAAGMAAHATGAQLAIDSTVQSPVLCQPLTLGADYVFHSATKYLNGHSDVLAGVLLPKVPDDRWAEIVRLRTLLGSPLAARDAWMLIRGLRTLDLRVERASANALKIAERFHDHPRLDAVLYPGLDSHPGHAIARTQMSGGFGGMMSFLVKDGFDGAARFIKRLKVILPATSLGGVESLAEHRKVIEGPDSPVPDNLIRLSIGIEAAEDLIADLEQALGQ